MFEDRISGSKSDRPGLTKALEQLRKGTLVVWKLDRLGRSLRHLIELINELQEKGIMFRSIQDGIWYNTKSQL